MTKHLSSFLTDVWTQVIATQVEKKTQLWNSIIYDVVQSFKRIYDFGVNTKVAFQM